jgi:4-aminobutyrate aminotransferase
MGGHDELLARHRQVMPDWLTLYYDEPLELVEGKGCRVRDGEGREYLDFFGGILTTMTGYGVGEVVEAVREQAGRMLHTSTLYLIRPMVELAELIASLAPMPDARVFFTTSGTEANEAALLLCATARRSNQVLALRNSYHGRSFATMGVTGQRGWSPSSLSPFQVSYVYNGYRFRSPWRDLDDAAFVRACADDLRNVIETTTSGDVACLIAEPIQGVGGFATPPDGFFTAFREVLDEYGILFVSDEVQTGWGRTGDHFWGIQAHDVVPDVCTFAKGLGNGLTIAGLVGRADLVNTLSGHAHSISTFGGNPLSCAGALANLRHLLAHDFQGNARRIGARMRARLDPLVGDVPMVGDVRGRGLMIGLELVEPSDGRLPNPAAAAAVLEATRAAGLLIGKGGMYGNCLRVAPPMCVTEAEADEGIAILIAALREAARA